MIVEHVRPRDLTMVNTPRVELYIDSIVTILLRVLKPLIFQQTLRKSLCYHVQKGLKKYFFVYNVCFVREKICNSYWYSCSWVWKKCRSLHKRVDKHILWTKQRIGRNMAWQLFQPKKIWCFLRFFVLIINLEVARQLWFIISSWVILILVLVVCITK